METGYAKQAEIQGGRAVISAGSITGTPREVVPLLEIPKRLEDVGMRLLEVSNRTGQIADSLGGSQPTCGSVEGPREAQSVVEEIVQGIERLHSIIGGIEGNVYRAEVALRGG